MDDLLCKATTNLGSDAEALVAALTLACRLALCNPRYLQQAGGAEWSALWQRVAQADEEILQQLGEAERESAGADTDACAPTSLAPRGCCVWCL